jgi:excisionase family DNA binding protein
MARIPDLPTQYLTYADVARTLNVSPRMARKLAASRQIKAVKIGSCVRIAPEELARFVRALPNR